MNGKYCNYSEAILSFPLVITVKGVPTAGGVVDFTAGGLFSDGMLALKNSHYNILHSLSIDYSNNNVVQPVPYLNQYINFKLNTEMSAQDEEINSDIIGYAKDSSSAYQYCPTSNAMGQGLCNNANSVGLSPNIDLVGIGDVSNEGIKRRQKNFLKVSNSGNKNLLLRNNEYDYHTSTGNNTIVNTATSKVFYYDCTLRLKDMSSFFANLPPIKGAVMKIIMVLNNNISFNVVKAADGALAFGSLQNTTSLTNPLMFCATGVTVDVPQMSRTIGVGVTAAAGGILQNDVVLLASTSFAPAAMPSRPLNVGCGSVGLPAGVYTVTQNICQSNSDPAIAKHCKTQCRLYIPTLIMSPTFEKLYLTNAQRNVEYIDYEFQSFKFPTGYFSYPLTQSTARVKRLIIIVSLSAGSNFSEANGGVIAPFHSLSSPFWDGSVAPNIIQNFQVSIATNNVYPQNLIYSYEQFMNELQGGMYGLNAGQVTGLCSSRISRQDYENNYKYYVVDCSRRMPEDENTPVSLTVSGNILSPKELEFFCFIEKSKNCIIDISTGQRLKKP